MFAKTLLLPMAAALAIGLSACGGGGGGGGGGGQPSPNPAPSSPGPGGEPPSSPGPGTDPAPPAPPPPDPAPDPAPPAPPPSDPAPDPAPPPSPSNAPPVADAGSDLYGIGGYPLKLVGAAGWGGSGSSDPEGGALTYAWAQTGGTPMAALTGASTAEPTITPPQVTERTVLTFTLTVTDPGGLSATDTTTFTVSRNSAPIARAGDDVMASPGDTVTLDGSETRDPESGPLTYAWAQTGGTPTAALTGGSSASATFTAPQVTGDTALTFTLTATDAGGLSATDSVTVTVNVNDAPTAAAGSDFTTNEGSPVTLDGSGSSDPDGDSLTYAWAQTGGTPTAALTGGSSASATFTAPQVTGDTALTFTLTVTDPGGLSATDTVTVTVKNVNDAPTASAGADVTTAEGYPVALDGSGSWDPENERLTYAWAQTGGTPTVTLNGASTSAPTFTAPQVTGDTALTFTLTVTDPNRQSATDTVTVTVQDNAAPTAGVRVAFTTTWEGHPVTLDGSDSSDPENGGLTYAWTQTGGSPTVALTGASSVRATFTAPQVAGSTALTFTLTVTDPGGLSATDTVTYTVRNNTAPTAAAGADFSTAGDYPVTLNGSGSRDPENGDLAYAWTQTAGTPTAALTGASTSHATFTAPQVTANAALTFTLTVTDPGGLSATDTVTVTVKSVNDAPTANAGSDFTISDGDTATLDGSASSDPENGDLAYAWTQTAGTPSVTLRGADTSAPSFATPQLSANASLTFRLTVTDPGGAAATDTVTVTVTADDDTPTANAGDDFTTYEGDMAALDGSAGGVDPGDGPAAFAWAQTGGTPSVALTGAATAAPTFTAPQVTADAALTFTLTVSEAGGQSATDSVTVTVANVRPANSAVRTPGSGETLEPAAAKSTASSWETAEYTASVGLPLINAAAGYAARTAGNPGGGGVTIAVMDLRPVDTDHPDLAGATMIDTGADIIDGGHGTRVAGVAAARRDGFGMHGVAYNANIVGISQGYFLSSIRVAFASAAGVPYTGVSSTADPAGSAHVAVMSYNYRDLPRVVQEQIATSVRLATGRGRIVVASSGNAQSGRVVDRSEPAGVPVSTFADEGIAGLAIAASALNADGTGQASWAHQCGAVAQYCLMAPGTTIYSTDTIPASATAPGARAYRTTSGTSLSAPYVAGAAAAVWGAFPNKTGRQVVDRLLTTAQQIDDANCNYDSTTGVSAKCGHGALDLGAAMNPVGFTSMALPGSGAAPVRSTAVRLPPGASALPVPALADTVVYDEQGFPFLHDLNAAFLAGEDWTSGSLVHGFLEPARREWTVAPLGVGAAFSFAGPADHGVGAGAARRAWRAFDPDPGAAGEPLRDYRFSLQPQAGLTVTVGQGAGAPGARTGFASSPDGGLFTDGLSVRPFAAFSGEGPGVGVDWRLDGRTRLSFSGRDGRSRFGAPRARLVSVGVDRRFAGGLSVKLGAGTLRERGARLGMRSSGGFGPAPASVTNFVDLGVEKPLSGKATAFGSYSFGSTGSRPGAPGSLVRHWGALRSDSLAVGVSASGVFAPGDRLTATASAPFRPRGRVAMVLAPAREVADGEVAFAARAVSLASAGREVRTQLVYDAWSGDRASAVLGGYARFGADAGAPEGGPDWGIAAKMRLGF